MVIMLISMISWLRQMACWSMLILTWRLMKSKENSWFLYLRLLKTKLKTSRNYLNTFSVKQTKKITIPRFMKMNTIEWKKMMLKNWINLSRLELNITIKYILTVLIKIREQLSHRNWAESKNLTFFKIFLPLSIRINLLIICSQLSIHKISSYLVLKIRSQRL